MKRLLFILLLSVSATEICASEESILVKEISDKRTTGKYFKGLEVILELDSEITNNAIHILPVNVNKAVSDLGESLIKEKQSKSTAYFSLSAIDKKNPVNLTLRLKNPSRSAKKVIIEGDVTLYVPTGGKGEKVVINNYLDKSGKELSVHEFEKRNIALSYFTKDDLIDFNEKATKAKELARKENRNESDEIGKAIGEAFANLFSEAFSVFGSSHDLTFIITDKENQIYKIELYNDKDQLIEATSRSSTFNSENRKIGVSFKRMLPYKGYIVVYLETKDNVKILPINLTIDLP